MYFSFFRINPIQCLLHFVHYTKIATIFCRSFVLHKIRGLIINMFIETVYNYFYLINATSFSMYFITTSCTICTRILKAAQLNTFVSVAQQLDRPVIQKSRVSTERIRVVSVSIQGNGLSRINPICSRLPTI